MHLPITPLPPPSSLNKTPGYIKPAGTETGLFLLPDSCCSTAAAGMDIQYSNNYSDQRGLEIKICGDFETVGTGEIY